MEKSFKERQIKKIQKLQEKTIKQKTKLEVTKAKYVIELEKLEKLEDELFKIIMLM